MKKILLSTLALVIMSAGIAYADGGKRNTKTKKPVQKKERTKTKCPNRPGCICN